MDRAITVFCILAIITIVYFLGIEPILSPSK